MLLRILVEFFFCFVLYVVSLARDIILKALYVRTRLNQGFNMTYLKYEYVELHK